MPLSPDDHPPPDPDFSPEKGAQPHINGDVRGVKPPEPLTNRTHTGEKRPRKPYGKRSKKIEREVCRRIAQGESLRAVCSSNGMPTARQVINWLDKAATNEASEKDREFLQRYVRARELQADHYVDEVIEIADDRTDDPKSRQVRVMAREWVAAVRRPTVYGKTPGAVVSVQQAVVMTEEKQKELQERHRKALERFNLPAK